LQNWLNHFPKSALSPDGAIVIFYKLVQNGQIRNAINLVKPVLQNWSDHFPKPAQLSDQIELLFFLQISSEWSNNKCWQLFKTGQTSLDQLSAQIGL
jgi:hypothetical protein